MDKISQKQLQDCICFLQEINESNLPISSTNHLNTLDRRSIDYSIYCRFKMITDHGKVKDEYQEKLNERGFAVEYNLKNKEGPNHFFIRTEKGLLTF